MITEVAAYSVVAAVLTLVSAFAYCRVWRARIDGERTPTGFGALLAFVQLGGAIVAGVAAPLVVALGIVAVGTALYWVDDAIELRASVRILISLVAGAAIGAAFLVGPDGLTLDKVILVCVVAALLNVILTNLTNFYDGADLNLATYVALTVALILLFAPEHPEWASLALACVGFIVPFAVLNRRPRTIYLGDSGSFAFAGLLTIMGVSYLLDRSSLPPEAAIPSALPALDVFYVFIVRLIERHDLLSRNWLHLYQRLNLRFVGFGYLLPQIVNAGLCFAAAVLLQRAGVERLPSVMAAMAGVTIPFYFLCRRVYVPKGSVVDPQPSR
jgi:UDP-N-acetylmuramyl pentapeptide phosphotransferase/UDP-N-acetylglucosamine-1-phosphate transferase